MTSARIDFGISSASIARSRENPLLCINAWTVLIYTSSLTVFVIDFVRDFVRDSVKDFVKDSVSSRSIRSACHSAKLPIISASAATAPTLFGCQIARLPALLPHPSPDPSRSPRYASSFSLFLHTFPALRTSLRISLRTSLRTS